MVLPTTITIARAQQDSQIPNRQNSLTKEGFIVSQIGALAVANTLPQTALPLIKKSTVPQT